MAKKNRHLQLLALATPLGLSLALIAGPADAAVQCSTNQMCYWNNGTVTGGPLGYVTGVPATGTAEVNVPDNVISSGRSNAPYKTNPANGYQRKWFGSNQVNIFSNVIVVTFERNTNTYLSGTSANNVIDDLLWS